MNIKFNNNKTEEGKLKGVGKKSFKISMIFLLLLIVATSMVYVYSTKTGYTNTDRTVIYGYDNESNNNSKAYDLDSCKRVNVVENTAWTGYEDCFPILEQPNVWCVQKGKNLNRGEYTVSDKYTVTDPVLAYILAKGPTMDSGLESYHGDNPAQNALWRYLTDKNINTADKKRILNGISCGSVNTGKGSDTYNKALAYEELISKVKNQDAIINSRNLFDVKRDDTKVTIFLNIDDNGYSFDVEVYNKDNDEKLGNSITSQNNKVEILLEDYAGMNIKLKAKLNNSIKSFTEYSAEYRILYNSYNQRLLVATGVETTQKTTEIKEISLEISVPSKAEYSVALEKFITQVNGKTIYDTKYDFDGDGFVDNKDVDYIQNAIVHIGDIESFIKNHDYNKDKKVSGLDLSYMEEIDLDGDGKNYTNFDKIKLEDLIDDNDFNNDGYVNSNDELAYQESIKKFDVNNDNKLNMEDVTDLTRWIFDNTRENKRYNKKLTDLDENKNAYKYENPVQVGIGDEITYTIKLENTGGRSIEIKEINDIPQSIIEYGLKLEYKGYIPRGLDRDYIIDEVTTNENGSLHVTFENTVEIEKRKGIYIDLVFKVSSNSNYFGGEKIENEAYISMSSLMESDLDGTDNNYDNDYITVKKYAVSLEKFITKINDVNIYIDDSDFVQEFDVNENGKVDIFDYRLILSYKAHGTTGEQNYDLRIGNEDMVSCIGELQAKLIREGINIDSIDPAKNSRRYNDLLKNKNSRNRNEWKKENPIEAKIGDSVTYIIRVRNTEEGTIKIEKIKDINDSRLEYVNEINNREFEFKDGYIILKTPIILQPEQYKDIEVKFKVNGQSNGTGDYIINKAHIEEIKNENNIVVTDVDGTDNNRDCDFIYVNQKYAISLEKFVSKVTDYNGNNVTEYTDRSGKRLNEDLTTEGINRNSEKRNNPVKVELGDIVTYTIRLTNTGDNTINKIVFKDFPDYRLEYNGLGERTVGVTYNNDEYTVTCNQGLVKGASIDICIKYKVNGTELDSSVNNNIKNTAIVTKLNENIVQNMDSDGTDNNRDCDYIKIKTYAVSLEKYVKKVIDARDNIIYENDDRLGKAEHNYDNNEKTVNSWKSQNVVTIGQGNYVTYKLIVKNNGETGVYLTEITDIIPLEWNRFSLSIHDSGRQTLEGNNILKIHPDNSYKYEYYLAPNAKKEFELEFYVNESNMSINVLKNTAEITEIQNRNRLVVNDTTQNDNKDSDYIQTKDIRIAGIVWIDEAINKTNDILNGEFDYNNEATYEWNKLLEDIKVFLYRTYPGDEKLVAETKVLYNSAIQCFEYSFSPDEVYDKMIKASKDEYGRWSNYHSYKIKFEYDGVTFTPTTYNSEITEYSYKSNAKEDSDEREAFNNNFDLINNQIGIIKYDKINKAGYIPESKYNSPYFFMNASTEVINLSDITNENALHYINLGLRGRDIFDLELTSDVCSVKVNINDQSCEYSGYNRNKVTLRRSVASDALPRESTINTNKTISEYIDEKYNQNIRKQDIDALQEVNVVYRINIKNASQTDGTATKIVNYYENNLYDIERIYYYEDGKEVELSDSQYEYKFLDSQLQVARLIINTDGLGNITKGESKELFIEYKCNITALQQVLKDSSNCATYNMTEIYEYTTQCAEGQSEFMRGLIDKDSAPGSAETEKVNLIEGNYDGSSTIQYYFKGQDLSKLKYEDDTYAAPVLYFVASEDQRIIEGKVFEDKTTLDGGIRTGNGKLDDKEVGIYGAKVELYEKVGETTTLKQTTTTNENGEYSFSNFLPGNYIIRYFYGNNDETVLLEKNKKSYNGEDFQSTNNKYIINGRDTNKLSEITNFWYLDNENKGISVAIDDSERRGKVSDNVTNFSDEQMMVLNNMRDGKNKEECNVTYKKEDGTDNTIKVDDIIEKTNMVAETPSMLFPVEKAILSENNQISYSHKFGEYTILNMNFGIAEVPVTTIDLQKHVKGFVITDSTGKNKLVEYENGKVKVGNILVPITEQLQGGSNIDVSIEDSLLQGARIEVTFGITSKIRQEKNFDGTSKGNVAITNLIDFIDNDLSYNVDLGNNEDYWVKEENIKESSIDYSQYNTIVTTKANIDFTKEIPITLEKVLSAPDTSLESIITNLTDNEMYNYNNIIEITGIDYAGESKDRVRNKKRFIIVPKKQHDITTSETIVIHPPTGFEGMTVQYYVLAVICLAIVTGGIIGIKKYVLKD